MKWLFNLLLFQSLWLLAVFGGDTWLWAGALLLVVHLCWSDAWRKDLQLMVASLLMGLLIDGGLTAAGLFVFAAQSDYWIPPWLMLLWAALGILPRHSLQWMQDRIYLAPLFGAVGGPLAYWGGVAAGAAAFGWPLGLALGVLAVVWAIYWPLLMLLAKHAWPAVAAR